MENTSTGHADDLPTIENIYKKVKKTYEAGRHVVGLGDLSIDVFLEVQNKRYS